MAVFWEKQTLLWIGIFGVAICLLLNQAPETCMVILEAGGMLYLITDRQLRRGIDRELIIPLCIILTPLLLTLLHPGELTSAQYVRGLVWSLVLITAFWILSARPAAKAAPWLLPIISAIVCVFFIAQVGADLLTRYHSALFPLLDNAVSAARLAALGDYVVTRRFSMFSNIHFFALFAVLCLPVSLFCLWQCRRRAPKVLLGLSALSGMYLLLKTGSRPGWLALFAAGVVVVPFLPGRIRLVFAGVLSCVPLVLYCGNLLGFKARVQDLLLNIATEERVTIWSDAWEMQKASDWQGWLFGHGLGSFAHYFKDYSHIKETTYVFPHNFFLEILFSSGIFGLLAVIAGYIMFYSSLITLWRKTGVQGHRDLAVLLISVMTAHFVHTFLTLPFLTGRAILSLAIIAGVAIWLLRQEKQHARELSPAYDHHSQL